MEGRQNQPRGYLLDFNELGVVKASLRGSDISVFNKLALSSGAGDCNRSCRRDISNFHGLRTGSGRARDGHDHGDVSGKLGDGDVDGARLSLDTEIHDKMSGAVTPACRDLPVLVLDVRSTFGLRVHLLSGTDSVQLALP